MKKSLGKLPISFYGVSMFHIFIILLIAIKPELIFIGLIWMTVILIYLRIDINRNIQRMYSSLDLTNDNINKLYENQNILQPVISSLRAKVNSLYGKKSKDRETKLTTIKGEDSI